MGRGSVLKKLKGDLQDHDLLRHQKRKRGDQLQNKQRKQRDQDQLSAIRNAFNPFNVKFNRQKDTGTGKKEAGNPVSARSAAEEQRRRTWEAEKRLKNKVGGLVDRRFGERDKTMSEESKLVERYAREKLNNLRKMGNRKSFNINDDDEQMDAYSGDTLLTHGGKALSFEDDFAEDDLGVDSADEEEPNKKRFRRDDFDSQAEPEAEESKRPKTKAEVMQEVIAKSKMHKLERQQQRQADDELVDSLNDGFDELMADLATAEESQKRQSRQVDDYDLNLQQLAFDKRADPKDRTKTEAELAEEQRNERLAAERAKTARMEGDELDIEVDGANDDAHLFGLEDHSSDEAASAGEEADDREAGDMDKDQASIAVPESLQSLKDSLVGEENPINKINYFVQLATPSRGSGSKVQLNKLAASLLEYALVNPVYFQPVAEILHRIAPKNDVGLGLANTARDLVHAVKRRKQWGSRELLLFSIVGSLFSTSDQWHVVVTSASLVITQRLSQSVHADRQVVTTNLFLCDLLLVFQRLSKRYIPEIPLYLLRVFVMLCPSKIAPIAERYTRISSATLLDGNKKPLVTISKTATGKAKLGEAASLEEIAVIAARIVGKASSIWRSLEAFPEVLSPLLESLRLLPHEDNSVVQDTIARLSKLIHFSSTERRFLELQNFRPIGIVTRAPLFDENYNPEVKGANMDPERRELQKLKALHKKERKSTLRDIRRDTEFEARQVLDEKRNEMAAYHEKLRRLEGQINGEEGAERNAYEREKQKKRRR